MPSADPAIEAVLNAEHLSEETRRVYSSKLGIIAAAAGNQPLLKVLTQHPEKVIRYITRKYNEIASQKTMLVSIMAVYRLLGIKIKAKTSYDSYLAYFDKLDTILRDRSKTNLPSKRQAEGFITHAELQLVRKKLLVGSTERLLLSFYGGCIPPVRNDLHAAFIHKLKCTEGEAKKAVMTSITPNCILLPYDTKREGALILREFKTQDRTNPRLYSRGLGLELSDEVRASLQQHPRDYLFTEARSSKPYTHGGFQQYASRTLKSLFGKPCTLTLLRHSYISHMLVYGKLSIKDKEELARDMCHSVGTQAQYQFIRTDSGVTDKKNLKSPRKELWSHTKKDSQVTFEPKHSGPQVSTPDWNLKITDYDQSSIGNFQNFKFEHLSRILQSVLISQKVTEVLKLEHVVDVCRSQNIISHQLSEFQNFSTKAWTPCWSLQITKHDQSSTFRILNLNICRELGRSMWALISQKSHQSSEACLNTLLNFADHKTWSFIN